VRLEPHPVSSIGLFIMPFDTLIHNGTIVSCNRTFEIIARGWIGVAGGKIETLGAQDLAAGLPAAAETYDARGGIVMPGLVNTHTHLPMTLFRGMADDLPLALWLKETIFPAERRLITAQSVRWAALLGCAEMALSGTTTCADGYFFEDAVAEAVLAVGLRAVLGQGVLDHPAPGVPQPSRNVAVAGEFCRRWQGRSPLIHPTVFCHSPYTCSDETLIAAKQLCDELGLLFMIHAAETAQELEAIRTSQGVSVIAYLDRLALLDARSLLVHAVWADEADVALIAARRAGVSHNPESNMKLASGIAPIPQMLAAGIPVGLGSDGSASNNDLDLFGAMDAAAKLHKVKTLDPTVLPAEAVVRMATIDGARALGLGEETGSLEPGKQADLIVIDTHAPHLTPIHNPASAIVYAAKGSDVSAVMVAGRWVVKDRRLAGVDLAEIMHHTRIAAGCPPALQPAGG
jgi:5-methylthioadenosine/S-adenosylhomocysteine deaminase